VVGLIPLLFLLWVRIMKWEIIKEILGDEAEIIGARSGFHSFLSYIKKHKPTKEQLLKAVDMQFERPDAIHEDIICVEDYLRRYKGKLFQIVDGRLELTEKGKKLLKAL